MYGYTLKFGTRADTILSGPSVSHVSSRPPTVEAVQIAAMFALQLEPHAKWVMWEVSNVEGKTRGYIHSEILEPGRQFSDEQIDAAVQKAMTRRKD